jgi:hypothetical protein
MIILVPLDICADSGSIMLEGLLSVADELNKEDSFMLFHSLIVGKKIVTEKPVSYVRMFYC